MHTCESSAEIMRGLQSRTTGVHSFNVEIILAPVVYVDHAWAALRLRLAEPFEAASLAFKETFGLNALLLRYLPMPMSLSPIRTCRRTFGSIVCMV